MYQLVATEAEELETISEYRWRIGMEELVEEEMWESWGRENGWIPTYTKRSAP